MVFKNIYFNVFFNFYKIYRQGINVSNFDKILSSVEVKIRFPYFKVFLYFFIDKKIYIVEACRSVSKKEFMK